MYYITRRVGLHFYPGRQFSVCHFLIREVQWLIFVVVESVGSKKSSALTVCERRVFSDYH